MGEGILNPSAMVPGFFFFFVPGYVRWHHANLINLLYASIFLARSNVYHYI